MTKCKKIMPYKVISIDLVLQSDKARYLYGGLSFIHLETNLSFEIYISALEVPIPTSEVFMFKITIEKHFESD